VSGAVAATAVAAVACVGVAWLLVVRVRLQRRLELVARASHELRGPAGALTLSVAALRREPGGIRRALVLEAQLDRMRAGLDDLEAARSGTRAVARPAVVSLERVVRGAAAGWAPVAHSSGRRLRFRWEGAPAAVRADRGRLAQALGNLVANAVEHGSGPVELRGRRAGARVRVEVRDGGAAGAAAARTGVAGRDARGRGLAIAALAVEEAGGTLVLEQGVDGTTAAIELPVAEP
jgi:signal transduction histidine kinase